MEKCRVYDLGVGDRGRWPKKFRVKLVGKQGVSEEGTLEALT